MHLDNNPLNNNYKNLQWGTHSMNIQQMIFEQRRLERLIDLGKSRMYISKRLKVSRKTLYNFIHRIQIRNSLE